MESKADPDAASTPSNRPTSEFGIDTLLGSGSSERRAGDRLSSAGPRKPKRKREVSISFEARFRIFCIVIAAILLALAGVLLSLLNLPGTAAGAVLVLCALLLLFAFSAFYESMIRPVQTLSNVVSALREEDYSFRARGAKRDDAMGELAREINALADMLQGQRLKALEAVALLQRVMAEMDAPLLAFDDAESLRLLNPAAERAFGLHSARDIEKPAAVLGISEPLQSPNDSIVQVQSHGKPVRWMVRRSRFRQRGVPHTLVVLSDVSTALREEEQLAWKRLIRVLGHEISNSLAPIKSIAGSLRSRLRDEPELSDLQRGLAVIESRADSLHRFVQSYRQLAQLPAPVLRSVPAADLIRRVGQLETRLTVQIGELAEVDLIADADQLEQMLINLVRNAVEAATRAGEDDAGTATDPQVVLSSTAADGFLSIVVADNGPGIANPGNLFVPFYTTKKSGTGVGLALARQIAEAHGGTIELRNRLDGAGCRAEVKLPLERAIPE